MQCLKDKFGILHLKPFFRFVSDEIKRLRLKFGHMLLSREFSVSVDPTPQFPTSTIVV